MVQKMWYDEESALVDTVRTSPIRRKPCLKRFVPYFEVASRSRYKSKATRNAACRFVSDLTLSTLKLKNHTNHSHSPIAPLVSAIRFQGNPSRKIVLPQFLAHRLSPNRMSFAVHVLGGLALARHSTIL